MFICKFCGEEKKTNKSLAAHQPLCKSNPEGKSPSSWATGNRKGIPSWNSGLSGDKRCKHTDESKKNMSEKMKERTAAWHNENGKRISVSVKRKVEENTWHTSLAKHMHIDYNGVDLHGSWELKYAQYLDANNVRWQRNKDSFSYEFGGKIRKYTPDFYLFDTDEYIEIKGYKTEKDRAKWEQFPKHRNLRILMKDELKQLGILI